MNVGSLLSAPWMEPDSLLQAELEPGLGIISLFEPA